MKKSVKNIIQKVIIFYCIISLNMLCFSVTTGDLRSLRYRKYDAVTQYKEKFYNDLMLQYQREYNVWLTRVNNIDLSERLAKNNPRRYEENLRKYSELMLEMPLPYSSLADVDTIRKVAEQRLNVYKEAGRAADNFRREFEKAKERFKNDFLNNTLVNLGIAAVSIVLTVATAGLAAPVTIGAIAKAGIDIAHGAYVYYNIENRDAYDVPKFLQSEEYKFSHSVSAAAKLTVGFATGSAGFSNLSQGVHTSLEIAQVGAPYYNEDTNKFLAVTNSALAIYDSSKSIYQLSKGDEVAKRREFLSDVKKQGHYDVVYNPQSTAQNIQNQTHPQVASVEFMDNSFYQKFAQDFSKADVFYKIGTVTSYAVNVAKIGISMYEISTAANNWLHPKTYRNEREMMEAKERESKISQNLSLVKNSLEVAGKAGEYVRLQSMTWATNKLITNPGAVMDVYNLVDGKEQPWTTNVPLSEVVKKYVDTAGSVLEDKNKFDRTNVACLLSDNSTHKLLRGAQGTFTGQQALFLIEKNETGQVEKAGVAFMPGFIRYTYKGIIEKDIENARETGDWSKIGLYIRENDQYRLARTEKEVAFAYLGEFGDVGDVDDPNKLDEKSFFGRWASDSKLLEDPAIKGIYSQIVDSNRKQKELYKIQSEAYRNLLLPEFREYQEGKIMSRSSIFGEQPLVSENSLSLFSKVQTIMNQNDKELYNTNNSYNGYFNNFNNKYSNPITATAINYK